MTATAKCKLLYTRGKSKSAIRYTIHLCSVFGATMEIEPKAFGDSGGTVLLFQENRLKNACQSSYNAYTLQQIR